MLTDDEKRFVEFWEKRRLIEKSFVYQLLTGLPIGLLFSVPIILILFTGRWWYKRADMVANSELNPWLLIVGVFLIALFVAIFHKRRQWEMREEQYQQLRSKHNNPA